MANDIDIDDSSVFGKVYAILDSQYYYGYLNGIKHYNPSKPEQRMPASKAFMYWYLENCGEFDFNGHNIKNCIVDCSNDQGIDAIVVAKNPDGSMEVYIYQAKFWQENVDESAVTKMESLWNNLKKGRDGFSGEIKDKMESLNVFDYLGKNDTKVMLLLITTSELESTSNSNQKSASEKWDNLRKRIYSDKSLNVSLARREKIYLNNAFKLGAEV